MKQESKTIIIETFLSFEFRLKSIQIDTRLFADFCLEEDIEQNHILCKLNPGQQVFRTM